MAENKEFIYTVGRRKSAVARVRLYKSVKSGLMWGNEKIEKGTIVVNTKPAAQYFGTEVMQALFKEPFAITNTLDKYAVSARIVGGGLKGQVEALALGIARALSEVDTDKFRPILKKKGLLTRDSRVRQRRAIGTGGKARRQKQSPKR